MSRAWKSDELRVCRLAGSERSGPVGRNGPDCTDAAPWAIQVKRAPSPALRASWLAQASLDAERDNFDPGGRAERGLAPRPWVLVQAWYRRGRPTLDIATLDSTALLALSVRSVERGRGSVGPWGIVLRRSPARPYLKADEIAALLNAPRQPWLIHQWGDGFNLATLDFRELVELGRLAGLIPAEREEGAA